MRDPVKSAQQALTHNSEMLFLIFPKTIRRIIREELWQDRMDASGKPFKSFFDFVEHDQWHGLGITYSRLQEYCKDDEQATRAVADALPVAGMRGGTGANQYSKADISAQRNSYGTSTGALLARIKRDYPKHADRIITGGEKANAVAVELGIRPATKTLRSNDTAEAVAAKLRYLYDADTLGAIREAL